MGSEAPEINMIGGTSHATPAGARSQSGGQRGAVKHPAAPRKSKSKVGRSKGRRKMPITTPPFTYSSDEGVRGTGVVAKKV